MKNRILIITMMIVMILTAYFVVIPVNAATANKLSDLIVISGDVDKKCLEVEGYVIIKENVNFQMPGNYQVEYLYQGVSFTREVIVIDSQSQDYFNMRSTEINTFKDYPMVLEKIESFSETKHLLLVKYLTNPQDNIGHTYMYIIDNNQITKEVQLKYNVNMTINDVLIDDDKFIITGTIYNTLYANYDLVFYVCRSDGLLLFSDNLGGSKKDEGFKVEATNTSYIIMGLTDSQDKLFSENKHDNSYFIMSIDKNTYEVQNVASEPNEVDFNQITFLTNDNKMYLVYQSDSTTLKLVNISDTGKYLKTKFVNFEKPIALHYVYIGNSAIKVVLQEENSLKIGTLSLDKGYTECFETTVSGKYLTANDQQGVLSLLYEGHQLMIIDNNNVLIYQKKLTGINNNNSVKLLFNTIIETSDEAKKITIHQFDYASILSDDSVIINGKMGVNNQDKSYSTINNELYGNYVVSYYFEGDFDLIINREVKIPLEFGVIDGGVYDLGIIIGGNAEGYLNNQRIEKNYQINEEGSYELELIGKDNLTKIIRFEVKRLSVKPKINEEKNYETSIDISTDNKEGEVVDLIYTPSIKTQTVNSHKWNWMYTVPVMIAIGASFVIIKFRY